MLPIISVSCHAVIHVFQTMGNTPAGVRTLSTVFAFMHHNTRYIINGVGISTVLKTFDYLQFVACLTPCIASSMHSITCLLHATSNIKFRTFPRYYIKHFLNSQIHTCTCMYMQCKSIVMPTSFDEYMINIKAVFFFNLVSYRYFQFYVGLITKNSRSVFNIFLIKTILTKII